MTDPSFEDRLKAASERSNPAPAPSKALNDGSAMAVGLRVGVELVAALAVGLAIGFGLDRWFGTTPLMLSLFVLLGGAAGIANVWRMMAPKRAK